jgi:hypothetical protein
MGKPQGAAISPSLRTLTRVPYASGDTAAPLLFLVQSEECTTRLLSFLTAPERSMILISEGKVGIQGKIGCVIGAGRKRKFLLFETY